MRTPRVYVPELPSEPGRSLTLDGDEAAHLIRVLRLKAGAEVEAFDGLGRAGTFRLISSDRRRAQLELLGRCDGGPELPVRVTCAVATPKGKRAKRLVEELTELGATAYAPLELERSSARPPVAEQARRWAIEACKQCLRNRAPEVLAPLDLAGLIAQAATHDLALLPDTRQARPVRELLTQPPRDVLVAIGPEGGFSDPERRALADAGFQAVTLGPAVLRIETAAAATVAAIAAAYY